LAFSTAFWGEGLPYPPSFRGEAANERLAQGVRQPFVKRLNYWGFSLSVLGLSAASSRGIFSGLQRGSPSFGNRSVMLSLIFCPWAHLRSDAMVGQGTSLLPLLLPRPTRGRILANSHRQVRSACPSDSRRTPARPRRRRGRDRVLGRRRLCVRKLEVEKDLPRTHPYENY
jgi:hypothetical protein